MKKTMHLSGRLTQVTVVCSTLVFSMILFVHTACAGDGVNRAHGSQQLKLQTALSQNKILQHSDGKVTVVVTITGEEVREESAEELPPVDLVVVLDRSGSMEGQKINDARKAILKVMERMGFNDRISVISYANDARLDSPLLYLDHRNRARISSNVRGIMPGGGTNLGSGLQYGIETLLHAQAGFRQRKIILISDGLANQGITSLHGLEHMAGQGAENNFAISTVGVGYDFNETLMTALADHGAGNYYFLENPNAFARIFEKEFEKARRVVASSVEIRIPAQPGTQIVDAGGYPLKKENGYVTVRPGDVLSGQKRKLYLTYVIDSESERQVALDEIEVQYMHKQERYGAHSQGKLGVKCVDDEKEVFSSVDKKVWEKKVIGDDYNRLKNEVAQAVGKGEKEKALKYISEYESEQSKMNDVVGSDEVAANLNTDLQELKNDVEDTFTGAPSAVVEKQKAQSKSLQYESYTKRRDKK